jgi:hypothetical protein
MLPRPTPASPPRPRTTSAHTVLALSALLTVACSNGGGGSEILVDPFDLLRVVATEPTAADVWLDDPVRVTFSRPIDESSLSLTTVRCEALDQSGQGTGTVVAGSFQLANDGTVVTFQPRLPRDASTAHGGLQPGVTYRVQLPGGEVAAGEAVRDQRGRSLSAPAQFEFTTRTGATVAELYRNRQPGGPRRLGLTITTATTLDEVPLNRFGTPPVEVRLNFDQPLDPAADNVPYGLDTDPLRRDPAARGNLFLEYDDPVEGTVWIPADVEFERNAPDGATVVLHPVGVLPNNATVRIVVEAALRDLSGEANLGAAGYDRVFGTFRTVAAWGQQWNGIVERFDAEAPLDRLAAFGEPMAEVGPGYLRAGFDFEGSDTTFDLTAPQSSLVLNTNTTTLTPTEGTARTFVGGVFALRNLTVPQGSLVEGTGSNPLVFLCAGAVHIAGTISVAGRNGQRGWAGGGQYRGPGDLMAGTAGSPSIPGIVGNVGGFGRCGGGSGGSGSPATAQRDLRGATGFGPGQQPGGGGRGGYLACVAGCYTGFGYNGSGGGSGGGGGALATIGDPHYRGTTPSTIAPNTPPSAQTAFQQVLGFGGTGCSGGSGTRTSFLAGGEPGSVVLTDTRHDNDFWGAGYDPRRRLRIVGELSAPIGGGGGGGGGDTSPQFQCSLTAGLPFADFRGGGGGAGGGVVVIKALGEIRITSTGRVTADGGNGGGGEQVGACGESGGGGGGAGGMVVLMSATAIRIEAHGSAAQNRFVYGSGSGGPFAGNDYDFAISADGGICTTGGFGTVNVARKYPASGQTMLPGTTYDTEPLGGFGGMGIVQLMTPPGDNADGTNTVLDDHIHFYLPGQLQGASSGLPAPIGAAGKRQLLAWRGLPDGGAAVDDFGNPVLIGNDEGDIRPAPLLLPSPVSYRTRARSRWIDTGRSDRRPLTVADGGARGIVVGAGSVQGPRFQFAGIDPDTGFAEWSPPGTLAVPTLAPTVVPPTGIASASADATFLGAPAYRVQLATAALGTPERFVAHDADLLGNGGGLIGSFRILSHSDSALLLEPNGALLPTDAVQVRVVARFFRVAAGGIDGLPIDPFASTTRPRANVRIGFAFHREPNAADPLAGRYPTDGFVHDLQDPALSTWLAANRPRFVMWDVLFDMAHDSGPGPAVAQPFAPRLELRELRLPFRF